jgi:dethiobiotin synthetase
MADLAVGLGLPVLIVVANRLGCLNHALLTLENIRARGLPCLGFILNSSSLPAQDESLPTNRKTLEEASGLSVIAEISHGQKSVKIEWA